MSRRDITPYSRRFTALYLGTLLSVTALKCLDLVSENASFLIDGVMNLFTVFMAIGEMDAIIKKNPFCGAFKHPGIY